MGIWLSSVIAISCFKSWFITSIVQWVGLKGNQETISLNIGLSCRFSLAPIHWIVRTSIVTKLIANIIYSNIYDGTFIVKLSLVHNIGFSKIDDKPTNAPSQPMAAWPSGVLSCLPGEVAEPLPIFREGLQTEPDGQGAFVRRLFIHGP